MRVRMTVTRSKFEAGKSYDLPADLAMAYVRCGRAYLDKSIDAPPEVKPVAPNGDGWVEKTLKPLHGKGKKKCPTS